MTKQISAFIICLFLLFAARVTLLMAQSKSSSKDLWTPEDVVHETYATDFVFSPNGQLVVWVKHRPSAKKDHFVSDLYLTHLDVKENGHYKTVQLTRTEDSDHDPVFSREGKTIYFLSSRDNGKDIWAMSVYGGSPHTVYENDISISNLKILGQDQLTFVAKEGKSLYTLKTEKHKDNTIDIEDPKHFQATRLFAFNTSTKDVKRLTNNRYPIYEYAVSKDGNWLVTGHIMSTHYEADAHPKPTYFLWNLKNGSKKQILAINFQFPGDFSFTNDSKGFYFTGVKSSDPQWNGAGISLLYYFDLSDMKPVKVDLHHSWGLDGSITVSGNDVMLLLSNGATDKLAYYVKKGNNWSKKDVSTGTYSEHVTPYSITQNGKKVIFTHATASVMTQYRIGDLNIGRHSSLSAGNTLISLNPDLANKPIAKSEVFHWSGAKNQKVDGLLYYPDNYKPGRRYPLIVSIHGGPMGNDRDNWHNSWAYYPNIFAQMGAFVLKPNYHGSSNHGLAFEESIKGHYYELEVPDIVSGVKALIKKGLVDKDSLGINGWSNGAILTVMSTIKHPHMFKAAGEGAADVDWVSDYGPTSFGVMFDQSYFLGSPWENKDGKNYNPTYIKKSPLFDVENLRTPTIIFQGGKDRKVTRDESWEYYRAIQQVGKVPVKFLWFPGEPHWTSQLTHELRKMREEIEWFKKYLWDDYKAPNPAFKKDSPLGKLVTRENVARSGNYFGKKYDGKLIPEVVPDSSEDMEIGRFEVTNEQYKVFDPDFSFDPGKANYPVTGISYKQAVAYTHWLSSETHQNYRLPDLKEAMMFNKVAKKSGAKENTLNYWAGYPITLDEAQDLKQKLQSVQHDLLMEVGSFNIEDAQGARVYDLGGNAAEMYNNNGEMGVYGYSAVSFVDPDAAPVTPEKNFIGFRVVKD
jgi:dipeptidyl aminopeptidase/acylaminoacyl peptidase